MIVERHADARAQEWDQFVRQCRQRLFLFERDYMDYHRDRFVDHSLIVRDGREIVAVLPAHERDGSLVSHGGLSYGGLLFGADAKLPTILEAFEAVLGYARGQGWSNIDYKAIPHIYSNGPADDDRYALYLLRAQLIRRDLLSVVSRDGRIPYQQRRERAIRKGRAAGVRVAEEASLVEFWAILSDTLRERHDARPVHALGEMERLQQRFPDNIRLFTARTAELLAGVLIFESERVAHCQYIASSPTGRSLGALDVLFDHLLGDVYVRKPSFDFGSSHEDAGQAINRGLIEHKEGFGARSVACETYRIDVAAFKPGLLTGALR